MKSLASILLDRSHRNLIIMMEHHRGHNERVHGDWMLSLVDEVEVTRQLQLQIRCAKLLVLVDVRV